MSRPDKTGSHRGAYEKNRKRILKTQNRCGICGHPVDKNLKPPHPMAPVVDHIIPVNGPGGLKGHPSDLSNLQLAHASCNRQKSNKIFDPEGLKKHEVKVVGNRNLPQSRDWTTFEPVEK